MSSSVRVSVVVSVAPGAATDTTTADYPGDKVTLPPATTGRPVRAQASQDTLRVRGEYSPVKEGTSLYVWALVRSLDVVFRSWAAHQSIKTPHIWSRRLNIGVVEC